MASRRPGPQRIVMLPPREVWASVTRNRPCFVHTPWGCFDVDAPLREIEASDVGASSLRVHRNWLSNIACLRELELVANACRIGVGTFGCEAGVLSAPVSRQSAPRVRRHCSTERSDGGGMVRGGNLNARSAAVGDRPRRTRTALLRATEPVAGDGDPGDCAARDGESS